MEKLIFRKFFLDTIKFLIIGTLSLSLIVWVIQAVNYLDFVSEDGHSFKVYFLYTLFNLPKIISRLLIFMFFIAIFYTISRYEEKNELIIFWLNGIKKFEFINFILKFSIIIILLQLILNLFIVPKSQDLARSYIRTSNIDYFPSLLKSKKFVSTVEDLTLFIEKKNEKGEMINIFLKDTQEDGSQIISAKKGVLKKDKENFFLDLYDGSLIDSNSQGSNFITYDRTQINLSKYSTKTTVDPKIQEQSTNLLLSCLITVYKYNSSFFKDNLDCKYEGVNIVIEELYKRSVVPFYILIVAIIGSCLALKSENYAHFTKFKFLLFLIGILIIVLSQLLSSYVESFDLKNMIIGFFPFFISLIFYSYLQLRLKE